MASYPDFTDFRSKRPLFGRVEDERPPQRQATAASRLNGRRVTVRSPKIVAKYEVVDGVANQAQIERDGIKIAVSQLFISGQAYDIIPLSEGKTHKVFEFVGAETITIKHLDSEDNLVILMLKTEDIVLRFIKSMRADQMKAALQNDFQAREHLLKHGIPMPEVFVDPSNFKDCNPTDQERYGDFWIGEKMRKPADLEDPGLKKFVKNELNKMAKAQKTLIYDFYPRNVMATGDVWKVVDPDLEDSEDGVAEIIQGLDNAEYLKNIFNYLIAWSNGMRTNYEYYTEEMPQHVKDQMNARLEWAIKKNEGEFPTSLQTHLGCLKPKAAPESTSTADCIPNPQLTQ